MEKPPYRVPTMREIENLPSNGLNVVSLFAGGGGSSTGYRMAGYRVLYANEFVQAAADTYLANCRPGTIVDTTDIRQVTGRDILDLIDMTPGELDLMDGSPPCSAFSTAGKTSAKWGAVTPYSTGRDQRVDDLFYEYVRILREVQPRAFVAENVSGLVKGVSKGYFKAILAAFKSAGYSVSARLLDASWLGVPQARQRLIFIGVRNDLGIAPVHPGPLPYQYTLRDALPWLTCQGNADRVDPGMSGADRPSATMGTGWYFPSNYAPPSVVAQGNRSRPGDTPPPGLRSGDLPSHTIGTHWDVPSGYAPPSVLGLSPGEFVVTDPETGQNLTTVPKNLAAAYPDLVLRRMTLGELRAVCSFPADYVLTGSYSQRWERLGRSVPPLMMRAIASALLPILQPVGASLTV